jgi:ribonuclease E
MSSEPTRASGDEDSWETLAEDLFGISFSKADDASPIPLPEDVEPAYTEEPCLQEPSQDSPAETADAFGEDTSSEPADKVSPETSGECDAGEAEQDAVAAEASSQKDAYWDVLNDWNWDEDQRGRPPRSPEQQSSGRGGRQGSRRRREPDSRPRESARPEKPPTRAAEPANSYVDDSDFGEGLLDSGSAPRRTGDESRERGSEARRDSAERESGDGDESHPRRRRRRRRRRGRPDRENAAPQGTEDESSVTDETPLEPADEDVPDRSEERQPDERRRRHRRPDRRRSREPIVAEPADEEPSDEEEDLLTDEEQDLLTDEEEPSADVSDEADEGEDDGDDAEGGQKAVFRNVPTWEEAVSYLLRTREARSGEPGPPRHGGESGRNPGRRGRRRR